MGGIVIMITMIIGAILLYSSNKEILPLSLAILGFGVVGFVDDFKKLILKDTKGLKPAYKIVRSFTRISCLCIIFNKNRGRNRNDNSYIKMGSEFANFNIYTICNIYNASRYKCS
jgi:UDP-N-acetylmuramyl pentapeptide phosphotransferase/UDP-N-acetylglucosamine-1-phosphate transferase